MQSIRLPALFFFASLLSAAASAQTSVYASAELTNYGYTSPVDGNFTYVPGTGHYSVYRDGGGISGGAVHLFSSDSRFKVGVDFRGMYGPGSRGGAGGFSSVRLALIPHRNPLLPYVQVGGGFLTTMYASAESNPTGGRGRVTSGAAGFALGLDIRTTSRFTIKAIELDGFAGSNVGHASIGVGVSYTLPQKESRSS